LPPAAVLALYGELGAGKTCFVQGLAEALGIADPVTSPTFTLIHEHRGPRPLYHIDLYRIQSAGEALLLGVEDYLPADGITAVEWAERAEALLPPDTVRLHFEFMRAADARRIIIRRP
jgi:tRNA threonylcarbamoyladenosine biosynthesis protein TsaE